jgi:recombination protein RecT
MAVGPVTEANGRIVKREEGKRLPTEMHQLLDKLAPEIRTALPKHLDPDRMLRIGLTALSVNNKLTMCTPQSFLGAIVQASQLGLEVNTPLGHAYLIPYGTECQLIIGYYGMMDLARRSGLVRSIYAHAVYEGDTFDWTLGLNPTLNHKPSSDANRSNKPLTHVYAVASLENGEKIFVVLTYAEVERFRARSAGGGKSGPWKADYEPMALKTAVRRLFRWLPRSADVARAVAFDEAPESGALQFSAADPEVVKALSAHGIDVDWDQKTGEVLNAEPGAGDAP